MSDITVIIPTYNEELHIGRAIKSVQSFAREVVVVDSFSTDRTREIAEGLGARFYQQVWENNLGKKMNWAFHNVPIDSKWIMILYCDECPTPALVKEIEERLPTLPPDVSGILLKRAVDFMGRLIRHGGSYPLWTLRFLRTDQIRAGHAYYEEVMDEHIVVQQGRVIQFQHDLVDKNLHDLTWYTMKHTDYASREAFDLLARKYRLRTELAETNPAGFKLRTIRWIKWHIYYHLPIFMRPFIYFTYRYFIRGGFLDGKEGLVFHFLQGYWYRFLVDAKILEVELRARDNNQSILDAIRDMYGFENLLEVSDSKVVGKDQGVAVGK